MKRRNETTIAVTLYLYHKESRDVKIIYFLSSKMWKPFFSAVTKRHAERKIVETSPRHLFRIINDVDSYSQFLPLCTHSKILKKFNNGRQFEAALTVGLPPLFTEEYVSRVTLDPDELTIQARSIESTLFEALDSKWILKQVESNDELCDVHFEVEMSVRNPVIVNALDQVLEQVAGRQVAAFEQRCREVPLLPQDDNIIKQ